jgi:lipoate-protein ligase A
VGGGATYLDVNQLFYQSVFHHSRVPMVAEKLYELMLSAPVNTLRRLGLNAELRAVNEIEVDGKRIAGIGGGRIGEASVVVGNLLFDFNYNMMSKVWRVPHEDFRELASDGMRERITTIWRKRGPINPEAVMWILLEEFEKVLGRPIERGTPKKAETAHSREVAERITAPDYLNLHREMVEVNGRIPPMSSLKVSAGVYIKSAEMTRNGQQIQGSFRVREGIIEEARLHSEPEQSWKVVEDDLRGVAFKDWQAFC